MLCHSLLYFYSAHYWSDSLSLVPVPSVALILFSHLKICLHALLYYKDCTTTRQSWLFSIYVVINNKQDEMKLENISSELQSSFVSLQFVCLPILRYTTSLFILKYIFFIAKSYITN